MPAVSNTSPLLNLAIIKVQDLLHHQFGAIVIPPAVLQEPRADTTYPGAEAIRGMLAAGWLSVAKLEDDRLAQALMLQLDEGEASAIALAIELNMKQILLDEREGRA